MKLTFTNTATPVSDYDIEEAYEKLRNKEVIEISNQLLLSRFLVGVKRKEIEPFTFSIIESDGKINSIQVEEGGKIKDWNSKVLKKELELMDEILWGIGAT